MAKRFSLKLTQFLARSTFHANRIGESHENHGNEPSVLVADGISRVSVLFNTQRRWNSLTAPHYQQTTQVRNLTSTLANEKYGFFTLSDDCPAAWAEFEGRKGVFIEGQVAPSLSGVQIVISSGGDKPIAEIKVETDSNGKYRLVCWYLSCKRDD